MRSQRILKPPMSGAPSNSAFDVNSAMASVQMAVSADRLDEAEILCFSILQNLPNFPGANFFLAVVASKRGDNRLAIDKLREVV